MEYIVVKDGRVVETIWQGTGDAARAEQIEDGDLYVRVGPPLGANISPPLAVDPRDTRPRV